MGPWIAPQDLRHVYGAVSIDQARHRLHRFYWRCATAEVPELTRVARTISAWQDELLAYFTTGGASNPRPSQRVDLAIEVLLGRRDPKDARGQAGARAPTICLALPLVATSLATPGCPGPGARRRPRPRRTGRLPRPPERSDRSCLPAKSGNRRGTADTALPAA